LAGLIGIGSFWVVDVARLLSPDDVSNGFWAVNNIKIFHLGITIATACFVFVILRKE